MDDIAVDKLVVPGLVFLAVMAVGGAILLLKWRKRKLLEGRVQPETFEIGQEAKSAKKKSGMMRFLELIGNFASHGRSSTNLWEELVRAGFYSKAAPAVYTGTKMLLFLIGLGGTAILLLPTQFHIAMKINLIFIGGILLFFVPNFVLRIRIQRRRTEITLHLPDAVDLLEICVSSGIGLAMAWNIVADEIGNVSPTLGNAMALTNFEIHLGVSRIDAMRRMSARTGVEKLSSLAATLVQTERFGTSISAALREFAQSLREERYFTAEEQAEKTAVKLIIPMVLFIFPAVFVVTAGPAVVEIAKMMMTY
jgi:tight adherence protein C